MTVNGTTKTGKTYSHKFVTFVSRRLSHYETVYKDLAEEAYAEYKPEYLVREIGLSLGWDLTGMPTGASTPRLIKELETRWMLGILKADPPIMIVLDGFHHRNLHAETSAFVQELITLLCQNPGPTRLILLNYSDDLLPPVSTILEKEALSHLTRPEIAQFFTDVATSKGLKPDPGVIDDMVVKATAGIRIYCAGLQPAGRRQGSGGRRVSAGRTLDG